jgi:putative membrane protein
VVVAVAVAALAYVVGVRRLAARGRRWPPARTAALAGAVVTAGAAAAAGDATFTAHMVEHLLLGMVVPVLVALAAPATLVLQAGGTATKQVTRRVLRSAVGRVLARPVVGFCLFGAGLVGVYLTPVLQASATNEVVHLLVHAHLLVAGLVFLVPVLGVDALPHAVPFAGRVLAIVLAVPFHAFLAVVMLSAGDPLADAYPDLDDQRAAAGLLWAGGELLTVAVAAVVFTRWWRAEERLARRAVPSPGCRT